MRLLFHLTLKWLFWIFFKYLRLLWSRDSNILTISENIFHFENVTLKLKFWVILSVYLSIYSMLMSDDLRLPRRGIEPWPSGFREVASTARPWLLPCCNQTAKARTLCVYWNVQIKSRQKHLQCRCIQWSLHNAKITWVMLIQCNKMITLKIIVIYGFFIPGVPTWEHMHISVTTIHQTYLFVFVLVSL